MNINRRQLMCLAGTSILLPEMTFAASSSPVIVGTWGGDFGDILRKGVDDAIMKPKGIEVIQSIGAPMERRTKIIAERQSRRGSMDVACLADFDTYALSQLNTVEELNDKNVPRLAKVLPFLKKSYSIPHIYSGHVIVYNTNFVKTPPKSFADLWDPKYKGKVGLGDFTYMINTVVAAVVGGGSPTNLAPAEAKLKEWKSMDAKVYPSTEALASALKSGEIWFTIIASARSYMWNKAGIPVDRVVPTEGAFPTLYEAVIPKNTRNKVNAFAYVDAMLSPEAQSLYAERMGYLPTVSDVQLPADLTQKIGFTEAERDSMLKIDYALLSKNQANILDFWNKSMKA